MSSEVTRRRAREKNDAVDFVKRLRVFDRCGRRLNVFIILVAFHLIVWQSSAAIAIHSLSRRGGALGRDRAF